MSRQKVITQTESIQNTVYGILALPFLSLIVLCIVKPLIGIPVTIVLTVLAVRWAKGLKQRRINHQAQARLEAQQHEADVQTRLRDLQQ